MFLSKLNNTYKFQGLQKMSWLPASGVAPCITYEYWAR